MDIMFNELVEIDKDFFALKVCAKTDDMATSRHYADAWRYALFAEQQRMFSVDLQTVLFKHDNASYYIEVWFGVNKNIGDKKRNYDIACLQLEKVIMQASANTKRYYNSNLLMQQAKAGTYVDPWKQQTEDLRQKIQV